MVGEHPLPVSLRELSSLTVIPYGRAVLTLGAWERAMRRPEGAHQGLVRDDSRVEHDLRGRKGRVQPGWLSIASFPKSDGDYKERC